MADQFLPPDPEEEFNPDTWTQKELLKYVYRELRQIRTDLKAISDDHSLEGRVDAIEKRLTKMEVERETAQRNLKVWMAIVGFLFTVVNVGLKFWDVIAN